MIGTPESVPRRHLSLGAAIDLYVGELARRGRSPETRRAYERVLFLLADRYPDKMVAELSADDCRRFLDRWRDAAPSTVALHVSVVSGFFCFLGDEGHVERSPMERIRRPPKKRPEDLDVVSVTKEDVQRLFAGCEDWQELLCLAMLAYLGPRRTAASRVRWRDVNLLHGTIRFLEKGGKVAVKPIPDQLVAILRAAIEHPEVRTGPEDYVIPNRRPSAVQRDERSAKFIWETVVRVAKRVGVRAHVHAIRRRFRDPLPRDASGRPRGAPGPHGAHALRHDAGLSPEAQPDEGDGAGARPRLG